MQQEHQQWTDYQPLQGTQVQSHLVHHQPLSRQHQSQHWGPIDNGQYIYRAVLIDEKTRKD